MTLAVASKPSIVPTYDSVHRPEEPALLDLPQSLQATAEDFFHFFGSSGGKLVANAVSHHADRALEQFDARLKPFRNGKLPRPQHLVAVDRAR